MLKAVTTVLALVVSLAMVGNLPAQDGGRRQGRHDGRHAHQFTPGRGGFEGIERMLKSLNLTDEQKAKLAELKKEYAPKFKEAAGKLEGILTAEQKKARDEAVKTAKEAGKKPGEVWRAGMEAVKLTDDQKAKLKDARTAMQDLRKEVHEKVMGLLTPEQKEELKKAREKVREEMQKRRPEVQ